MISNLLMKILVIAPWVFLIWLIAQGLDGDIDGLLVFILVLILIPIFSAMNIVTIVLFKGRAFIKKLRNVQHNEEPLTSENYAELPWWSPKKRKK